MLEEKVAKRLQRNLWWFHRCSSWPVVLMPVMAWDSGGHARRWSTTGACSGRWPRNTWFDRGYMYGVSWGLHGSSRSENGACEG